MPLLSGWMKQAVIEVNKPKHSIIDTLRKRLAGWEEGRSRHLVHASDITKTNFCPRHWAFLDMAGQLKGESSYVSTALRVTYDMGHETARILLEEWAGDAVYGNWRCRRCGDQRTMCSKPSSGCPKHKDCIWQYLEVVVESPVLGVVGSFDVLFDVGVPKLLLTELKTINPTEFDAIVAPLPEHRLRTALYLRLLAESPSPYKGRVNLHEGKVFYISRGYGKKNEGHNEILPFKEFTVQRDDESIQPIMDRATQLKIFRQEQKMPSGICATALDKAAKGCTSCTKCFSGGFPAQQPELP